MDVAYQEAVIAMQGSPPTIRIFNSPICFDSANGYQRCVQKPSPYFPPNFASKVGNGYATLVQSVLRSVRRYAADVMQNKNNLTLATGSSDDFWFLYEVPLVEGAAGGMMAFVECALSVVARLGANANIGLVCYGVSLAMTFIVFIFLFGNLRRSLLAESRLSRAVLTLECKPMIEYIETLAAQLE
jgi:hypothetical protein